MNVRQRHPLAAPIVLFAAALLAAAAATAAGQDRVLLDSWGGTMEEHEGAIWVINPAEPLWPDDGQPRFEFELEQVFGADESPEEALLGSAAGVTVDDAGRVYVVDGRASEVVAFDTDGTVLWRVSGPGQGPADIEALRDIEWDGANNLVLLNQSGTRLDTWSTDGVYLSSFRLADVPINSGDELQVVDTTTLYVVSNGPSETRGYRLVDGPAWRLDRSSTLSTSWADDVPVLSRLVADMATVDDVVVIGSVFAHEFNLYSVDGAPLRRVMRPDTGFVASVSSGMQYYSNFGYLLAPVRLPGGNWLGPVGWTSNIADPEAAVRLERQGGARIKKEWHAEWALYDSEGRWLTSRSWEHPEIAGFGVPEFVGHDGSLYTTSSEPFPQVRRYRLTVRPPG